MSNEDDSLWITFNGELYNYQELRESLRGEHRFKTRSDTEVILHLYEELGRDCVRQLRGMFAFAIYDTRRRSLFIARDHLGQKPLYYTHDGGNLAFASEIKALLALEPELRELDHDALHEYLTIRIITPPRSMFRRVRKLPPAHTLYFCDGRLEIERFWNLDYVTKRSGGFDDALTELEDQIRRTIRYHLVSDVEVGAFLSGGLDSSIIVAMMSEQQEQPVKTFTGDVPYEDYSELPYARAVAEKYRTERFEFTMEPSLLRTLPEIVWHLDEPSDSLSSCMYYISRLARQEVKVVLGGDGGDELFGGYDRYYGNLHVGYYAMLPELVRRQVIGRLLKLMPEGFWYRSTSHKLRWMQQLSFYSGGRRYAKSLGYFYFSDEFQRSLYTEEFRSKVAAFDPEAAIRYYYDGGQAEEVVDRMLYADCMLRLPDHPVMISDRMTMAHGLEARSPFLDHKLAEFCATLPPTYKVRGRTRRYIQLKLAERLLPPEVVRRKKQGFNSPFNYMLADEFKLLYRIFLDDSLLVRDGHLERPAIAGLLEEHRAGKVDHGQRLWLLCNSEIWYRMYIENQSRESILSQIQTAASQQIA
jgi:asparagine synthase (glutamine-hydrolysing)